MLLCTFPYSMFCGFCPKTENKSPSYDLDIHQSRNSFVCVTPDPMLFNLSGFVAFSAISGPACSCLRVCSSLRSRLLLKYDSWEILLDTFIQRLQAKGLDKELVSSGLEAALLIG
jgi:hypothetical protein